MLAAQIVAILCMTFFGALGGAAAAITTRNPLPDPETPEGQREPGPIQEAIWERPVLGMALLGILGSLTGALILTLVADGRLSDIYFRVLMNVSCPEIEALRTASEALIEAGQNTSEDLQAATSLNNLVQELDTCPTRVRDMMVLIGLSLILGFAAQRLLTSLSEKILEKVNNIQTTQARIETAQLEIQAAQDGMVREQQALSQRIGSPGATGSNEQTTEPDKPGV